MFNYKKLIFEEINKTNHQLSTMNNFSYLEDFKKFVDSNKLITNISQSLEFQKVLEKIIAEGRDNDYLVLNIYKEVIKMHNHIKFLIDLFSECFKIEELNLNTIGILNKRFIQNFVVKVYGENWLNFLKIPMPLSIEKIKLAFDDNYDFTKIDQSMNFIKEFVKAAESELTKLNTHKQVDDLSKIFAIEIEEYLKQLKLLFKINMEAYSTLNVVEQAEIDSMNIFNKDLINLKK
ncbi:hypothetical protein [[Acholeplasma] multilocale]|uniref:hypothetical protein n=1 Tax=[Acholeplasma] multilocale TaxID=264638 RepID=UPI000685519E|nr:hypothetical protein [[Acholeplasma] multilocale]